MKAARSREEAIAGRAVGCLQESINGQAVLCSFCPDNGGRDVLTGGIISNQHYDTLHSKCDISSIIHNDIAGQCPMHHAPCAFVVGNFWRLVVWLWCLITEYCAQW